MNWLNISCDERDCMIYLCLFKIFKRFRKVVLAWKNWEKLAKMGKNGCPKPRNYTLLIKMAESFPKV